MVGIICIQVLTKRSLINNHTELLISNIIVLFSNVLRAILCMILYRNQFE